MTLELFEKSPDALKTIREVAEMLNVAPSALRFWEEQFPEIRPIKLKGNRRYYRAQDIDALLSVKDLLYAQGYTIKGAKAKRKGKAMTEQNMIERDLLGEIKKGKKGRGKASALELVKPEPLTLDEQKRADLEAVKADLMGMQEIIRPYL